MNQWVAQWGSDLGSDPSGAAGALHGIRESVWSKGTTYDPYPEGATLVVRDDMILQVLPWHCRCTMGKLRIGLSVNYCEVNPSLDA